MTHQIHLRAVVVLVLIQLWGRFAFATSNCGPDGVQASGSIYRICMPAPEDYNGRLVVFAHGFQDAGTPVRIPEEQLALGGLSLPALANGMGFGFATNSYSKTGLAVRQGMDDILDLVNVYTGQQGPPEKIYLTGGSEGGLITALLTELHPEVFTGGLAACAPVGDFPFQIRYFGNARATFEYFFPGLIPGDPFYPPQELIDQWGSFYEQSVVPVVFAASNRDTLDQWVKVARLPFDPANYRSTVAQSVADVLRYSVVNLNDAAETLGGFPFDNRFRWYSGSNNDLLLNLLVPRVAADPSAVREMQAHCNTTGRLQVPLMTLHTTRDQQVPYRHEVFYVLKTASTGALFTQHINFPVDRYGHCNFTAEEVLFTFAILQLYAGDLALLEGVGSVLQSEALTRFESLARRNGLPYRIEGESLKMITTR